MLTFNHESTRYTCKPETAARLRAELAKPKKHKFAAHAAPKRNYPKFTQGMTTAEYVALYNSQHENLFKPFHFECANYHKPAPMLDMSQPECVEDENPDYVYEPAKVVAKKGTPAQIKAALAKLIRAVYEGDPAQIAVVAVKAEALL